MANAEAQLKWRDALALQIRSEYKAPVISNYRLAVELSKLVQAGAFDGRPVSLPKRGLDLRMFYEARSALKDRGVLSIEKTLPNTFMRVSERKNADPAESLCAIDPFGYLAFLSAMSVHGLTNRLPRVLYYVSPEATTWRQLASERMARDLGDFRAEFTSLGLPELHRANITKLDGMIINLIRTKELGGWRHLRDESLRVATLGRTFLQMLQKPDLCGGIRHVIEVFEEQARPNLQAIISELNQHGNKVDKVRAGYLLEEVCGISDERIQEWVQYAARGGSRKLDAQTEYQPVFSEKWCLSINV